MKARLRDIAAVAALLGVGAPQLGAQGIFTCVDAQGRKLTSDRTIAECVDREQLELNSSGTVKRHIGPTLTARERVAQEARERQLAEVKERLAEERRRDRALLIRYPSRSVHDKERQEALDQVEEVIRAARKRLGELQQQRKLIEAELEFYKNNPAKIPLALKRQIEDNKHSTGVQERFISDQLDEKKRITLRFDDELVKLRQLWSLAAPDIPQLERIRPAASRPAR